MAPETQREDPAHGVRRTPWMRVGRLLPAALRTRLFEPAYYDLLADRDRLARDTRLGWRVIVLALESYCIGGPRLVWDLARGSRRAGLILGLALLTLLAILVIRGSTTSTPLPYLPAAP